MRNVLFLLLLTGLVSGMFVFGPTAAAEEIITKMPQDTVLIYYRKGREIDASYLLPYASYVNQGGEPKAAPFFDGFIFLSIPDRTSPGWEEALFAPGRMVNGLEEAATKVNNLQKEPEFRYSVYLALPEFQGDTGDAIAAEAIRFIDDVRNRFEAGHYKHIQLAGFYWFHEGIRTDVHRQAAEATADYIHGLEQGFQLVIIPYDVGHPNRPQVTQFGQGELPMDYLWLQPNFLWPDRGRGYDRQDLDETASFALSQGASVEIEFDEGATALGWRAARYRHYLAAGLAHGYIKLPLAYYEGGGGLATAAKSPVPAIRQLYEDTFAFARNMYSPHSTLLGEDWNTVLAAENVPPLYKLQFSFGPQFLQQGLWVGRHAKMDALDKLRLVEPDPNQSYWLIVSFRSPSGESSSGKVTIKTNDGQVSEVGEYPLDGERHTRWYLLPSSLLEQGLDPVPNKSKKLNYDISFSAPVALDASWALSAQWPQSWDARQAELWAEVDPTAYAAREGVTAPGVRWDEDARSFVWFGMDSSRALLLGLKTAEGQRFTYEVKAQAVAADGSGTFIPPDLPQESKVDSVWAQPAGFPWATSFGVEGDTTLRTVGVSVVPGSTWSFRGQPVGTSRRLSGSGKLYVVIPDDGSQYVLQLSATGVSHIAWSWRRLGNEAGEQGDGDMAGSSIIEIPCPVQGGEYELTLTGIGLFSEAKLVRR